MNVTYSISSPYYKTPSWGQFLDVWGGATIPPAVTDARYQIDPVYRHRPDMLAYDMYKDSNLWWVFAVRNPDVLIDPLLSFEPPVVIYVPSRDTLKKSLGI